MSTGLGVSGSMTQPFTRAVDPFVVTDSMLPNGAPVAVDTVRQPMDWFWPAP
jgi:hypothetical protein